MLSNEQRAHDLAIATLNTTVGLKIFDAIRQEIQGDIHIDVYAEYKKCYGIALEAISRDF